MPENTGLNGLGKSTLDARKYREKCIGENGPNDARNALGKWLVIRIH